jgi:hypothetical protein
MVVGQLGNETTELWDSGTEAHRYDVEMELWYQVNFWRKKIFGQLYFRHFCKSSIIRFSHKTLVMTLPSYYSAETTAIRQH